MLSFPPYYILLVIHTDDAKPRADQRIAHSMNHSPCRLRALQSWELKVVLLYIKLSANND